MTSKTALEKAFDILGNPAQLAYALNITPWAVYKWNVSRPPKERCLDIQELTDNQVTAEQLRPDVNWDYERAQRETKQQPEEA
ncbi:Cro/Cl family transcriptional regulator [Psychrobacter sp. L7]|uniref:transcriptional regulator n=1 Tax=Psychrobacter sp. L7 TaxID=1982756 RepID=UPI000C2A5F3F|nr:Cro/CI family transcriptional regulator [Psychrobacter sp. L7]PJX25044.1 Cro/Cl family transcriptional regulator [Psychrobacter sp. L7]